MCCLLCCIGCGPINKNCGIGNCAVCLAKYHWSFRVVAAVVAVAVYHFNMRSIRLNRIEWHAFCGGRRTVNGCFGDNNLGVVNIIMCVAFVRTKWKWSNSFGEFEPTNWVRQRTFVQCVPNMRGDKILLLFQSATQNKMCSGRTTTILAIFFSLWLFSCLSMLPARNNTISVCIFREEICICKCVHLNAS